MAENLSLVALARIQALEAAPSAEAFRETRLAGGSLDAGEVVAWLRSELGARTDEDCFDVSAAEDGTYLWSAGAAAHEGMGWRPYSPEGAATDDLAALAVRWSELYGWTSAQTFAFALGDEVPVLLAVKWNVSLSARVGREVSGPLSQRIRLECRQHATTDEVAHAYREAQARARAIEGMQPRIRSKPITSQRSVGLAVMGARVLLGEFASWVDARTAYNAAFPDEPAYTSAAAQGLFRRDVRDAYRRVTGLTLGWQPDRKGEAPKAVLKWQDGTNESEA